MTEDLPGLARYIDAVSEPVDIREVIDRRQGRRSRRAVALAFVAVLAAILAAVALVPGTLSDSPPRSTTGSTSTSHPLENTDPIVSKSGKPGCMTLTVREEPHDACLSLPGGALWRVAGVDYVVAATTMAPFGGERVIPAGPSGFVVLTLASYRAQAASDAHDACYTPAVSDAVEATVGPNPPPFMVTTCSPSYAIVNLEYVDAPAHRHDSVLMLARYDDGWKSLGTLDFTLDRSERCRSLPDTAPAGGGASARYLCSIVG